MKNRKLLLILIIFFTNAIVAITQANMEKCEDAIQRIKEKEIVNNCMDLVGDLPRIKTYNAIAQLLNKVSLKRIDEIFDFGEADPLASKYMYNKKLYTNLEKYYLKQAYASLKKHSEFNLAFLDVLFAKISFINVMYFQISESGVFNNKTIELEKNFKSKSYIPHLKRYLNTNPNDKDVLFLLGLQGIKDTFVQNQNPMILYSKVVNQELFKYLKKSATLGFYKAKVALIKVSNWEKYTSQLTKTANSNNKNALYKLGMLNYNNYIDSQYKQQDYLEKAILNFNKAQLLGHKDALKTLISIYYRDKPNKSKYTELLKKSVNKFSDGYLYLGNLYWCNGDKSKAKEMYIKSKNKGGINATEANYSLEDLTKLKEPYNGCRFK